MSRSRARLTALLETQRLAVLSSECDGVPYASLVAIATDGLSHVYFATTRATRKWNNVARNPRVALLVDDRQNSADDFHEAAAATGVGEVSECESESAGYGAELLVARHPTLVDFVRSPSTGVLCVEVGRWYLVERFQRVEMIDPGAPDDALDAPAARADR